MMLPATNEEDIESIEAWVTKRTENPVDPRAGRPAYTYLTIREYSYSELNGCSKYEVVWLGWRGIDEVTLYIDNSPHIVVHARD